MFQLSDLPYSLDALQPFISKQTMEFHYGKHHQAYVTHLNQLLEKQPEWKQNPLNLEQLIRQTAPIETAKKIFNNAAQVWNHTFFWESMAPNSMKTLPGALQTQIQKDFGSFETFQLEFQAVALNQFGSGWVWLLWDRQQQQLRIGSTSNAEVPWIDLTIIPLFVCDVWEHAYYLDYQNRRGDFVQTFLKYLVNWDRANQLFPTF